MSDKQTVAEPAEAAGDAGTAEGVEAVESTETTKDESDAAQAAEATPESGSDAGDDPATRLTALEAELEQARREAEEQQEQLLRTRADMDNLRKRTARDLENAHKFSLERFAMELLPVRDSLELGLDAANADGADVTKLREGSELTLKMLTTALEKSGIVEVVPEGEKFNPDLHQAMATQPSSEVDPGQVMTVYQKGYTLNDRLLRPALVIVSAAPPSPPADAEGA
ncbi:MAG: nucleotide exchange factor GrpE [Gammaproteobacteria bacterium]|nr:MAG: nucleotide exchange factor GrpE [Gammaproteobacteria bacterium]